MTKCPYFNGRIIFKVDIKVNINNWRDDEVAAIRKIETKKQHKNLTY